MLLYLLSWNEASLSSLQNERLLIKSSTKSGGDTCNGIGWMAVNTLGLNDHVHLIPLLK